MRPGRSCSSSRAASARPTPRYRCSCSTWPPRCARAGYRPRIADLRLGDFRTLPLGDPVFVGITAMSGPQIRYGLEFAERVRAERPGTPIVWGGVHPTLLPEQTAADARVDVVVRGEGELVVGPLADALAAGEPLDAVAGITFATGGGNGSGPAVRSTPDAALIDLDAIPVELPYDLLPLPLYSTLQAGRVHLQTSRGCPSRCGFCYNTAFNKRRWRGKSPERVVDEMEWLLRRFPQAKILDPVDDNFFVDRKRVEAICELILSRGLKFRWRANCRFDYLAKYDAEFLRLVERAGCMELDFGGESGSARMQDVVCKEVSADEILTSVANLRRWAPSIDPFVSLAQRPARRDLRRHGEDVRPHGRDGPRQPAHAALRDLPVHAVPEPAARRAAARVQPAAVAGGVGPRSRCSTSCRRGTRRSTWRSCARSPRSRAGRSTRGRGSTSTGSPSRRPTARCAGRPGCAGVTGPSASPWSCASRTRRRSASAGSCEAGR